MVVARGAEPGTPEPAGNGRASEPGRAARTRGAPAWVALSLLALVNAFNLADRMLFGVIQEPIKHEFRLDDFQLGLLGGAAFAILYAILSVPIARVADRVDRISVVAVALGLWSAMTAACGAATGYLMLLFARAGVSIGEAGGVAPSISYLSDLYSIERRATALAVFAVGGPAGAILATVIGGQVAQHYGWRAAFYAIGAIGLVFAVIVRLVLREVRTAGEATKPAGFVASLAIVFRKRSYVNICAAGVFAAFVGTFISQYTVSFLIRSHGMTLAGASAVFGGAGGLFGTLGAFLGGFVADRVARRRPHARTLVIAAAFVVSAVAYALAWWTPLAVAIPALCVGALTINAFPGVSYAVASAVTPPGQRATAIAFLTLAGNLLGYALGPPILGALSDGAARWELARAGLTGKACDATSVACAHAQASGLRWALTAGAVILLAAAYHQYRASRTLVADLEG